MRSRKTRATRGPTLIALAVAVLACSSRDTDVSCSTLTCSLDAKRFERPPPVDAGPPTCGRGDRHCRAEDLSLGGFHACAIAPGRQLLCWGDDSRGQLGGGSGRDAGMPMQGADAGIVPVLEDVAQVAAGGTHTCALDGAGSVYCWGDDREGQVDGEASETPVELPVATGVDGAVQVAAGGAHSCAVVDDRAVCWGSARFGQSGRELADRVLAPAPVPGTEGAVQVSAGLRHSCAVLASRRVTCWGELLDADGTSAASAEPRLVPGLEDVVEVVAGAGFSCARRQDGSVACWGNNASGQLGDGTRQPSATPVEVSGLEVSLQISAGGGERDGQLVGHACSLTRGFFVQCWGRNAEGQLGIGGGPDTPVPQLVMGELGEEDDEPLLPDVTIMGAGGFFTCSIDHDGPVLCWGDDSRGQRGTDEINFGRPTEVDLFRD